MRNQANTAMLLAGNAMLMRLRVREALEKVATVLTDKDTIAREVEEEIRRRAGELGLEFVSAGVRAGIRPGGTGPRRPLRPTGSPVARKRP